MILKAAIYSLVVFQRALQDPHNGSWNSLDISEIPHATILGKAFFVTDSAQGVARA